MLHSAVLQNIHGDESRPGSGVSAVLPELDHLVFRDVRGQGVLGPCLHAAPLPRGIRDIDHKLPEEDRPALRPGRGGGHQIQSPLQAGEAHRARLVRCPALGGGCAVRGDIGRQGGGHVPPLLLGGDTVDVHRIFVIGLEQRISPVFFGSGHPVEGNFQSGKALPLPGIVQRQCAGVLQRGGAAPHAQRQHQDAEHTGDLFSHNKSSPRDSFFTGVTITYTSSTAMMGRATAGMTISGSTR